MVMVLKMEKLMVMMVVMMMIDNDRRWDPPIVALTKLRINLSMEGLRKILNSSKLIQSFDSQSDISAVWTASPDLLTFQPVNTCLHGTVRGSCSAWAAHGREKASTDRRLAQQAAPRKGELKTWWSETKVYEKTGNQNETWKKKEFWACPRSDWRSADVGMTEGTNRSKTVV